MSARADSRYPGESMKLSHRAIVAAPLVLLPLALVVACSRDFVFPDGGSDGRDATDEDATLTPDADGGAAADADAARDGDATTTSDGGDAATPPVLRLIGAATQYLLAGSTCVVRDGGVLCWGADEWGQLGRGGDAGGRQIGAYDANPSPVVGPEGGLLDGVRAIAMGDTSVCALRADRVFCWGDDGAGQLGAATGTRYNPHPVPVRPVQPIDGITQIDCGGEHCFALAGDGTVYAWGYNSVAQLTEAGAAPGVYLPIVLSALAGVRVIAAGRWHSCAAAANGDVLCWGYNDFRQAGQAASQTCVDNNVPWPCILQPRKVAGVSDAVELALARDHGCARSRNGDVSCWGRGTWGQLGVAPATITTTCGDAGERCTETARLAFTGAERIAVGGPISCAMKAGRVSCWGSDEEGQRGQGSSTSNTPFPTPVEVQQFGGIPLTSVVDLASSDTHCCALKQNGEVWCWGSDQQGAMGPGPSVAYTARRVVLP
jgi:alpha-tubulin suppressor-like RCC1 family protein